jgi:hypothetical protein
LQQFPTAQDYKGGEKNDSDGRNYWPPFLPALIPMFASEILLRLYKLIRIRQTWFVMRMGKEPFFLDLFGSHFGVVNWVRIDTTIAADQKKKKKVSLNVGGVSYSIAFPEPNLGSRRKMQG